jgi:hypothetical protein
MQRLQYNTPYTSTLQSPPRIMAPRDHRQHTSALSGPPVIPLNVHHLCPACLSTEPHEIGDGAGPHVASLCCGQCGRWLRWLSRYQRKQYLLARSQPAQPQSWPDTVMALAFQTALLRQKGGQQ